MTRRKAASGLIRPPPNSKHWSLYEHETDVLDPLPLWMTRLFLHLVRISNFETGKGSTTFAQLVRLLTPSQSRFGPREYVPNEQAVRRAVLDFEECGILSRDKDASMQARKLFFTVCDRQAVVRPTPRLEGVTRRGVDNGKARHGAAYRPIVSETRRGDLKGL